MERQTDRTGIEYRLFAVWRLLAALLVMAYHFCHFAPNAEVAVAWFERMTPLLDMFFALSGFLIFERYGQRIGTRAQYGRFLVRRFARLFPLHLVTLSFFIAVGLAAKAGLFTPGSGEWRYDFGQLLPNLLLIHAWGVHDTLTFNYVSWSLSAEWFAYLLLPVVVFAAARGGLKGLLVLLGGLLAGLEAHGRGAPAEAEAWYDAKTWAAWRVLADFIFGALIAAAAARCRWCIASRLPA